MGREIKFRGRSNNNRWICGFYVARKGSNKTKHYIYTGKTASNETDWCEKYEVDPKTIGQFTGREDKNGKEIFDGDVLLYRKKEYSRVVQWDKESAKFKMGSAAMHNCHLMEIIGNKYENKDLLDKP